MNICCKDCSINFDLSIFFTTNSCLKADTSLVAICINDENLLTHKTLTIFMACSLAGVILPRFCFHENLPLAGNCRVCLLEVQNLEKPVAACITDVEPNLKIWTENVFSRKARENVMETLLLHHPLDCPICDQAGECDLQEQSLRIGTFSGRAFFSKRSVLDKNLNFFIKTIMTRCIHCTRCVRFNDLLDNEYLGVLNRGTSTEISNYSSSFQESELAGNVIDLCPVAALTSHNYFFQTNSWEVRIIKNISYTTNLVVLRGALTGRTYAFQTRPWEIKTIESIDLTDGMGSNIYVHYKDSEIIKISPKPNRSLNGNIITDKCRFSADAFTNNRLKKIHVYKYTKASYRCNTWFSVKNFLRYNKEIHATLFVDAKLDLQSLLFLKKICNYRRGYVKLSLTGKIKSNDNFFIYRSVASTAETEVTAKVCILLSADVRTECALLNFKLRLKFKKTMLRVFGLGGCFSSDVVSNYLAIRPDCLTSFAAGKLVTISASSIVFEFPLILVGESFYKTFLSCNDFIALLHTIAPSAKIIKIQLLANSAGIEYLGVSNKRITKNTSIFCVSLEDNIFVRTNFNLQNFKKRMPSVSSRPTVCRAEKLVAWLTAYKPQRKLRVSIVLPLINTLSYQGLYMNLEHKVQKTEKFATVRYRAQSLFFTAQWVFSETLLNKDFLLKSNHLNFFEELVATPLKVGGKIRMVKTSKTTSNTYKISLYPVKLSTETFYSSDSFVKNSRNVLVYAHNLATGRNNFTHL